MSDLDYLRRLDLLVRPFSTVRPPLARRRSAFSASIASTVGTLKTELRALEAEHVVVELDYRAQDLRLDGWPRANVTAQSPAVAIAFRSMYGPLRYATGEFRAWQDNLRAIVLSMDALRSVDRYGVSKRGEQYVGWRAIETMGRETAEAILAEYGGEREALLASHPDHGGTVEAFQRVQDARRVLTGSAGG